MVLFLPINAVAAAVLPTHAPCGLPALPNGCHVRLEQSSWDDAGTGGVVWPAARALCRWQADLAEEELVGARVLELGAGTGACGLFAAGLGASSVCLTDGGPPGVLALACRK